MGDYEHGEAKPYFLLVLETDAVFGIAKLKLKGPKIPGTEESPSIGIYRKNGKYVLVIGAGEHTVEAKQIPDELRAFFEGRSKAGIAGPQSVPMPGKGQLIRSDGSYMPYQDYNMRVSNQAEADRFADVEVKKSGGVSDYNRHKPKQIWTPLPEPLYNWLIRMYRQQEMLKFGPLYL